MYRIIILVAIAVAVFSCGRTTFANKGDIFYANIWEDDYIVDSLMFYNGRPSFEAYRHLNSVKKQVARTAYLETFIIGKQKFGIIADSAYTRFYKYRNRRFNQIDSISVGIGWIVNTKLRDLNLDGYNDLVFSQISGGFHGEDNYILFYDPAKKTLVRDTTELINLDIDGDTLWSRYRLFYQKFVVRGMKLHMMEEAVYNEEIMAEVIKKFDESGALRVIDTIKATPEENIFD